MRIRLLDPLIANQIAAGEVIERPASVVKELIENSLDAGADKIELEILQGGLKQIRVHDNGSGIYKDDLPLAVARHGTSKISLLDELDRIHTLGFRGEALASIAAVSQLILTSCPVDQENAWQVEISGIDKKIQMTPSPHPNGTTTTVYDIFFNTPARRKFMRAEKSEFLAIQEVVKRMALSHFAVKFNLTHNHRSVFSLPRATEEIQQEQRLNKLFGKGFLQHAFKIDATAGSMRLWGWLATENYHRAQSDQQYFYINKRVVRDKLIQHAMRQFYHEMIPANRQAAYLLFFEIDPELVDVNVHPTKHEVRFRQARLVHDFIVYALKQCRNKSMDYHMNDNQSNIIIKENNSIYENSIAQDVVSIPSSISHAPLKFLFTKYLLLEQNQSLLLIDMQLAVKFFLQSIIQNKITAEKICVKPLLMPMRFQLDQNKILCINKYSNLFAALFVDIEMQIDHLMIRAMPEILFDVTWQRCIEKLISNLSADALINLISQEYKINQLTQNTMQRFLPIWLSLEIEARHGCSRELSETYLEKFLAL